MAYPIWKSWQRTESYESYLAPRVSAVQSERRPGPGGPLPLPNNIGSNPGTPLGYERSPIQMSKCGGDNSMVMGSTTIYSDSPSMLPRTPLAPGKLFKLLS